MISYEGTLSEIMCMRKNIVKFKYQKIEELVSSVVEIEIPAGEEMEYVFSALEDSGDFSLQLNVHLAKGARVHIGGVVLGRGSQRGQVTVKVFHQGQESFSRVCVKAVLLDSSTFDLRGKIRVEKEAEGTEAFLESRSLLLSPKASARNEPVLEIKTDNVKVSHGTTISPLDSAQLFYLKSRGLSASEAKGLLTQGFLGEVVDRVLADEVANNLRYEIMRRLGFLERETSSDSILGV